jgi:hypothetical protein
LQLRRSRKTPLEPLRTTRRRFQDERRNATDFGKRRFFENFAKFPESFRARKKPPLDGKRVERRFRGFLSFERDFLETLKRFSGGA